MDLKLGGKLEIGDLILVSYSHAFVLGIFAGHGKGTIQFYTPAGIIYRYEHPIESNTKLMLYKDYIHGYNVKRRVVKVNKDVLHNDEDIENYEKAIEILKLENIIK